MRALGFALFMVLLVAILLAALIVLAGLGQELGQSMDRLADSAGGFVVGVPGVQLRALGGQVELLGGGA